MKKSIFTLVLLVISFTGNAQVPSYYDNADIDLTGQNLLEELSELITDTHTTFLSYTPGVWNTLKVSDLDPDNNDNILLLYGYDDSDDNFNNDRSRDKEAIDSGGTNTSDFWNREHVLSQSLADPSLGTTGAGADAHNLRPCDPTQNSSRSNRKFADGSGNSGINSNGYWYPGDEWKGDVARIIMFMYLRYEDRCLPSAVGVGNTLSTDSNMIDLFLEWNVEDPVSSFEQQRNDGIASSQGNRNPFIDNPAFATAIWGGDQAEDLFGNSNEDSDGGSSSGNSNSLIISEYVEGSSYNKALEISNVSGSNVNLSSYSLKKQTNGSGDWSTELSLSGTLSSGNVYIIANSNASSTLLGLADLSTNTSVMTFNGNDPVGLFYNDTLIDIVGDFSGGSSNNFGDNTTLVRDSNANATTSYNSSDWTVYNSDTYNYLGAYLSSSAKSLANEIELTPTTTTPLDLAIYPNSTSNFIQFSTDSKIENSSYIIYNQAGAEVKKGISTDNSISLEDLTVGLYFIKINSLPATPFIKKSNDIFLVLPIKKPTKVLIL